MEKDIFSDIPADIIKKIIENSPVGIYISDMNGKFVYGNKKAEEIVGYRKEELIGKSFKESLLLDLNGIARALKLLALNKLGKETGPDEFELKRKDGTSSTVIIRTKPIEIENRKFVIGMVEDITERKKMEIELKERNEELEKVQRLTVGREIKMVQLKKEIERLKKKD